MKNKKRVLVTVILSLSSCMLGTQISQQFPVVQKNISKPIMTKLFDAVDSIRKICAKDPNHHLCRRLQASDSLGANLDIQSVVKVAHTLEQDSCVCSLAQKITDRLDKKLVYKCFVENDKRSCAQFERHLKYKALRCGGVRCLWGERKRICQAAAFTAAVKCIDCGK